MWRRKEEMEENSLKSKFKKTPEEKKKINKTIKEAQTGKKSEKETENHKQEETEKKRSREEEGGRSDKGEIQDRKKVTRGHHRDGRSESSRGEE